MIWHKIYQDARKGQVYQIRTAPTTANSADNDSRINEVQDQHFQQKTKAICNGKELIEACKSLELTKLPYKQKAR